MATDKVVEAFMEHIRKRFNESLRAHMAAGTAAALLHARAAQSRALAHGYTMKVTCAALREETKLSMSYQTFRKLCRRGGSGNLCGAQRRLRIRDRGRRHQRVLLREPMQSTLATRCTGLRHDRVPRMSDIYG